MFWRRTGRSRHRPKDTKVLVVDDDSFIREALAQLLQIWGYQPETASDGIEALEKMHSWLPRVVIVDLQMPRMGGMDLLKALQNRAPRISCIVITGGADSEKAAEASSLGAFDFIEKPLDPQRLQMDLLKCLDHSSFSA
ncbi:MAG: response regulator [Terriglobia bacterium]